MKKLVSLKTGQAVLVVVLISVIALTIGLSIAGRTVTDIKMSRQMEESQRAFSAAEAGIEAALLSGTEASGVGIGNASYSVKIRETSAEEFVFWSDDKEDSFQFWLADYNNMEQEVYSKNRIRVAWGSQNSQWNSDNNTPAITIAIIYKEGNDYKVGRYFLDPRADRLNNFCKRDGDNCPPGKVTNFLTNGETVGGTAFQFGADLSLADFQGVGKTLQIIRGLLFYNNSGQPVGFKALSQGTFPNQGKIIESVGVAGNSSRKVKVFQSFETLSAIFDFALFSSEALEK